MNGHDNGDEKRKRKWSWNFNFFLPSRCCLWQIHSCYLNLIFCLSLFVSTFHLRPPPHWDTCPRKRKSEKHTYSILKLFMQMFITHLGVITRVGAHEAGTYFSDSIRLMILGLATSWIKFQIIFIAFCFHCRRIQGKRNCRMPFGFGSGVFQVRIDVFFRKSVLEMVVDLKRNFSNVYCNS